MQHTELPGLEPCEAADRGEIRAHQREVVMAIRLADAAHAPECGLVADVPAERVTGSGRVGDERSGPHRLHGAADDARLPSAGVGSAVFAHCCALPQKSLADGTPTR